MTKSFDCVFERIAFDVFNKIKHGRSNVADFFLSVRLVAQFQEVMKATEVEHYVRLNLTIICFKKTSGFFGTFAAKNRFKVFETLVI